MSRSFRHTRIFPITTARSEKQDKRFANRRFRHAWKQGREVTDLREVSDEWVFDKDGKRYWHDAPRRAMTK
jgi:hypothetical protein